MSDLLPCPFCGGDAYTETYIIEAAAGCRECQFKVTREHRPYEYDGLPKVIAAWNRRALPAVQPDPREAALRAALDGLLTLVKHANFEEGWCCCGDDMLHHQSPMDCGHTPVDMGEYHASLAIKEARAALKGESHE